MIQAIRGTYSGGNSNTFYLNTYDKYEDKDNIEYKPILTFTNQMTGKRIDLVAQSYDYTNKDRYVKITFVIKAVNPIPGSGSIDIGNKDYPFGFYDVIIRENTTNGLPGVIDTRPIVYTGLMNLSSESGNYENPAVEYTEYTTNDADTDSVYITN
jgi:hypothetical protein|tara:strand:+ start:813 stop:1277 length:465 start_codon:yes stop_codon:yes gene_type:complete